MLPRGMAAGHDQRVSARARARAEALIRASQRTTTTVVLACVLGSAIQLGFAVFWRVASNYGWNGITGVAGVMVPIVVAIIAGRWPGAAVGLIGGALFVVIVAQHAAREPVLGGALGRAALDDRAVRRRRGLRQPAPQPVLGVRRAGARPRCRRTLGAGLAAAGRVLACAGRGADDGRCRPCGGGRGRGRLRGPGRHGAGAGRRDGLATAHGRQPASRRADATGSRDLHGRPADRRHAGAARAAAGRRPRPRRDPPPVPRLRRILGR